LEYFELFVCGGAVRRGSGGGGVGGGDICSMLFSSCLNNFYTKNYFAVVQPDFAYKCITHNLIKMGYLE